MFFLEKGRPFLLIFRLASLPEAANKRNVRRNAKCIDEASNAI